MHPVTPTLNSYWIFFEPSTFISPSPLPSKFPVNFTGITLRANISKFLTEIFAFLDKFSSKLFRSSTSTLTLQFSTVSGVCLETTGGKAIPTVEKDMGGKCFYVSEILWACSLDYKILHDPRQKTSEQIKCFRKTTDNFPTAKWA